VSANTTGISVHVLGLDDKTYLGHLRRLDREGSVTGYCIKFRRLAVVNAEVLHAAIRHGMAFDHRN
jgi:hypothetical protein